MENSLPKGWSSSKLGELCNLVYGKGLLTKELTKDGYTVFGANGVIGFYSKYTYLEPKVVISCRGAASGAIHLTKPKSFVTSNSIVLDLVTKEISNDYLRYAMLSIDRTQIVTGTAQPQITIENLKDLEIPLPPLAEQHRIVAKLDVLLARVTNCKNRLEKIPALLKNLRQSVLAAAVSGELTKEWREKNKVTRVSSYKEFKENAFKGNDDLPDEWSWITVEDYLVNFDSARVPISQEQRQKRQGKYPYYGATGIIDTIDDYTHDGEFILISEDGKNLQFRNKPICFLASGKFWVNNHAHILQVKSGFQNRYVVYFISVTDLNPYLTGIDQVKLSQKNMNGILIPVPPKEEQNEIVRKVEELFHFADSIEARYQKAKAWFDKIPQAILAKAFRGELVEQDENDEPATVLLERIKKEKQKTNKPKPTAKRKKVYEENEGVSLAAEE